MKYEKIGDYLMHSAKLMAIGTIAIMSLISFIYGTALIIIYLQSVDADYSQIVSISKIIYTLIKVTGVLFLLACIVKLFFWSGKRKAKKLEAGENKE